MSINVLAEEVIQLISLRHSLQAAASKGGRQGLRFVAFVEDALQVTNGCIVGQEQVVGPRGTCARSHEATLCNEPAALEEVQVNLAFRKLVRRADVVTAKDNGANARPAAVDLSDGVAARERWVLCQPSQAGSVVGAHGEVIRRENREVRPRDGSFFACVAGGLGSCVLHFAIVFESLKDIKFAATSSRKFILFLGFFFSFSVRGLLVLESKTSRRQNILFQSFSSCLTTTCHARAIIISNLTACISSSASIA